MSQKQSPQQTVEKLLKQAQEREERNELSKKEFAELKKACRGVFSTRNGKVLAQAMMKFSGIYRINKEMNNPYVMGRERGQEFMYLFFVKGMLSSEQLSQIEITKET